MEFITDIVAWIKLHWLDTIVPGYLAFIGLASWVVKLTPTLKDDTYLLDVIKFIAKYFAVNTPTPTDASRPVDKA
jgi:hypothetical protein